MLSNGFARPLHLKRKPSRLLAGYLVILHVLAAVALLQPLALSVYTHAVLWLVLLSSAGYHVRYYWRQRDGDDVYWIWQAGGAWLHGDDEQLLALVSSKSVATPWFVRVTLAGLDRKQQHLLIVRDQLDADSFRRLRVRLKLDHDEAAASSEESV
jgi:hypothetical protein